MRETWLQSLGWEDPLEKGKATLLLKLLSCNRVMGLKVILKSYSVVLDMQYLLVLLSLQILKTTSETGHKK